MLVSCLFTKNTGQPATGLTLAEIDMYLYSRAKATGTIATVWAGVHPTEEVGGGMYSRSYTSNDDTAYDYFAYAQYTGATVLDSDYSCQDMPAVPSLSDIWGYSARTLTQGAASVTAAVAGSTITVYRGTTWAITLTGLGNISTRTKLYFSLKRGADDLDADALVKIQGSNPADAVNDGLVVLNGSSSTTKSQGSITVNNETTGSITIALAAAASDDLATHAGLIYDVKMITAAGATELSAGGTLSIVYDVTRSVA